MINISKNSGIIILLLIVVSAASLVISIINLNAANVAEKKLIKAAKEIEELKFELIELKRTYVSGSAAQNGNDNTNNAPLLQKKLNQMRAEIEALRKSGDSKALEDYKNEKNRFLMDYANEVKKSWTEFLHKALVEKGMDPDDIEMIKYDYNVMLDKIRDEQFRWYDGDSSEEELNETVKGYAKDFFADLSKSVGDRKASITLGIVFPDQLYRKSLFEDDK